MKHLASLFLLSFCFAVLVHSKWMMNGNRMNNFPMCPKPTRLAFLSVGLVLKLLLNMELQRSVFMSTCKIPWYMEKSPFK